MLAVLAIPGDTSGTVTYGTTSRAARYVVTVTTPGQETVSPQTTTNRVVPVSGLVNGREYEVTVEAFDSAGALVERGTTVLVPAGLSAGGIIATALDLTDGRAISAPDAVLRRALAGATSTGSRWRYDYLRAQAIAAAGDAARLDEQVASLVQLDVAKVTSAEEIFTPYVIGALNDLQALASKVKQIPVPDVGDAAARLADAINTVALLERLLTWLGSESVLGFWVGLFGALIDDIAALQTDLPRTRRHVRKQFDSGSIGAAIVQMLNDAKTEILTAVDDLAVPLRAAVGDVVEQVAGGLEAVFESFDDALLLPSGTGAAADPLTELANQLMGTVDALVARVKAAVTEALTNAGSAGAAATLFEVIVATYLVLPILAALVIAIGGGPFAAAALAAAVTLAGQELVHLVVRWLTGPIPAQLDALRAKVAEATQALKDTVGSAIPANLATPATGPQLRMLASQLGNLGDLVPDELLHEAAALVESARDVVMRAATDLGLAAEQALGMEHATAFDLVDLEYVSTLPSAPRLPGGTGNGRFAPAALLRDLGRLEHARTQLLDGKELVLTQRLSLFELLGGTGSPEAPVDPGLFAKLLAGEDVVVRLTEENLVDRGHPGLYRVLIADVRLTGVFANAPTGVLPTVNLPVHVTHLGPSRTRVRRGANPYAPDLPVVPVSDSPHAPGASEARARSPKWGSAYLAEDRDPRVASLGFATLVRDLPPETSVFNVFPRDARVVTVAGSAGDDVTLPFATRDAAQYRPFENRGIEGELLVRLPTAVAAELLADTPASLLGGVSPLRDLVLEVTLRACYDDDLAAAVRTAQAQRRDVLRVAGAAVAPGVRFARAVPVRVTGESERRTIHVSLRAHRDETLRLWQAFLPAYKAAHNGALPTAGANWTAVEKAAPLAQQAAFQPLPVAADATQNQLPTFEIAFARSGAATDETGAALGALATRVTLTPEMLGIPLDLVTSAVPGASGGLVGVSVSVVPMGSTATTFARQVRAKAPALQPGAAFTHASVCALDRGVHVLGKSGSLWETRLAVEDWQPFRDVGDTRAQTPGSFSSVEIDGEVHVCTVAAYKVWHAVRGRDGSWSPWGEVAPGIYTSYRTVAVAASDGLLHVVAVAMEHMSSNVVRFPLLHTVRGRDGKWLPFGDASAYCGKYFTYARSVDATDVNGELHVVVVDANNDAYHTIRYRDGRWQQAGPVNAATGVPAGTLASASVSTVAGEMHLCALTTGGEFMHSIRHEASWEPLRTLYGTAATFTAVDCAGLGPDLHVVLIGSDQRLRHVMRQGNWSWTPLTELADAARYETVVSDPLAGRLTLAVTGRLAAALPGFGTATTPARLVVGPDRDDPLVGFGELFQATAGTVPDKITLNLPRPQDTPIYDVIVSLTYVVPVRVVEAVPS